MEERCILGFMLWMIKRRMICVASLISSLKYLITTLEAFNWTRRPSSNIAGNFINVPLAIEVFGEFTELPFSQSKRVSQNFIKFVSIKSYVPSSHHGSESERLPFRWKGICIKFPNQIIVDVARRINHYPHFFDSRICATSLKVPSPLMLMFFSYHIFIFPNSLNFSFYSAPTKRFASNSLGWQEVLPPVFCFLEAVDIFETIHPKQDNQILPISIILQSTIRKIPMINNRLYT